MTWSASFRLRQHLAGSLWPLPLLGGILGAVLGDAGRLLDRTLEPPSFWTYSAETATTVLATIVGAMVALTGFALTVSVLGVQMATGTFSAQVHADPAPRPDAEMAPRRARRNDHVCVRASAPHRERERPGPRRHRRGRPRSRRPDPVPDLPRPVSPSAPARGGRRFRGTGGQAGVRGCGGRCGGARAAGRPPARFPARGAACARGSERPGRRDSGARRPRASSATRAHTAAGWSSDTASGTSSPRAPPSSRSTATTRAQTPIGG